MAVAEVQRAVAVALTEVAESRERIRVHRYLDLSQRSHDQHHRSNSYSTTLPLSQYSVKNDGVSILTTSSNKLSTNVLTNEEVTAGSSVNILNYPSSPPCQCFFKAKVELDLKRSV